MTDEMMTRDELAQYDEEYDKTPPAEGGGSWDPVPDGEYDAEIEEASVVKSKSGKPMAKFKLRIVSENSGGRILWKNAVLIDASLPYAKKDLAAIGIKVGRLSELPAALRKVIGAVIEVAVRNKGDNQNVFFNKLEEAAQASEPDDSGSEFPF